LTAKFAICDGNGCALGGNRSELPPLTSLRGIAAVTVLLHHCSFLAFNFAGGAPPWLWRRGSLAVDLFFFLSGFVLTHVYGRRLGERRNGRAIGRFLWARFCRIYPASLFTAIVFVLAFTAGHLLFPASASFTRQLIAALLLMQVPWLNDVVINGPSWSISAEWYAYLLFPFVVLRVCRLRGRPALALFIALLTAIAVNHTISLFVSGWGALARALPEFTVGVFAYRFYSERLYRNIFEKDATLIGVVAIVAAAFLTGAPDGLIVILLLAFLLAWACNSGRMAPIINAKPLCWLGEVSYSVYIFQALPFMVAVSLSGALVAYGFGGVRFEAITALFAIGSGVIVHRCVDVPARAALRRLPDRMMAFAVADRAPRIRPILLASAGVPEQDR
jgi:peptidoglycan/LPS O-acetylase OafA/YrhL